MEYKSNIPYTWEARSKYLDLPFPEAEYEERVNRMKDEMTKKGIDSLLVFGNPHDKGDVMYLSNFYPFGRAALIIRKDADPVLITDGILHGEPINSYSWMTWLRDFGGPPGCSRIRWGYSAGAEGRPGHESGYRGNGQPPRKYLGSPKRRSQGSKLGRLLVSLHHGKKCQECTRGVAAQGSGQDYSRRHEGRD